MDNKAIIIITIVMILMSIFPLPAILLDVLMVINILSAFLVLLFAVHVKKTMRFSILPSMLLVLAVYNLLIHISFTRLILTRGAAFDGKIIRIISSVMSGSEGIINLVTGFAIFLIFLLLLAIMVVKRTGCVSEVAALFILEGLPAKMMAIEAEYSSGVIDQNEAALQKEALQMESDFYGAMDGAGKFISGSFKMGIFITIVSIIAGIIIGVKLHKEDIIATVKIYVPLSIAAGVFAQFPVLFESIAIGRQRNCCKRICPVINVKEKQAESSSPDLLTLELGFDLIPLVDKEKGAELLEMIQGMRRELAQDTGIVVPKIHIVDNLLLENSEYCIKIRGAEAGRGDLSSVSDQALAIIVHLKEIIKQNAAKIMDSE